MGATLILTKNHTCRLPENGEVVEANGPEVCLLSSGIECPECGDCSLYGILGIKDRFTWWYDGYGMLHWDGQVVEFKVENPPEELYKKLVEMTGKQAKVRHWIYFGVHVEPDFHPVYEPIEVF